MGIFIAIAPTSSRAPKDQQSHADKVSHGVEMLGHRAFHVSEMAQDRVFGEKIISLKAFFRSMLLSIIIVSLLYTYSRVINNREVFNLEWPDEVLIVLLIYAMNTCLDALSVAQTRFLFRFVKDKSIPSIIFISMLDYFLSIVLSPVPLIGIVLAVSGIPYDTGFTDFILNMLFMPIFVLNAYICDIGVGCHVTFFGLEHALNLNDPTSVFMVASALSSFFTSVWIWLHVLGSMLMKISAVSSNLSRWTFRFAQGREWYLMAPVILALAAICLGGLPFVALLSL